MERETGFEPATACLEGRGSTTELLPHRGEILEGGRWVGVKGVHSFGWVSDTPVYSVVGGWGFGCSVWVVGDERRLLGRCPRSCASGAPTPRGKGVRPAFAAAAAFGPVYAGHGQGPSGPPSPSLTPRGWLHRYRAARRLVQRPGGASCRRNMSKFAGATRSAGTTGSRLN